MNGTLTPSDYGDRLEAFRKSDAERDALVAEVLRNYEDLQLKYVEKCHDFDNEQESRRLWQGKAKTNEIALAEHKKSSGSNSFVLVILDGDGALFHDYLYAMGKDGGSDAAHMLNTEIRAHLKATHPDANVDDWSIVVQVFVSLQGLAMKLQACGLVTNPNEIFEFTRAFNFAQPLFNFIDVGIGKERADHKIRETLRLFLPNAQCKHVFFGPCNDTGYLVVLEPYKRDYASRLTLVETRPAEKGFLSLGLKRVQFPALFRNDNLPGKPPAINTYPTPVTTPSMRSNSNGQMQPDSAPFIPQSVSPAPSSDSTSSSTWASVGKAGSTTKNINIAPKKAPARRHILLNGYDQRLDSELPKFEPAAQKRFDKQKEINGVNFCNNYHLTGKCESGEYCDYKHGEKLTPGEQLVLKHKARSRPCPNRSSCRAPDCTFGHHCKFGDSCSYSSCYFRDTHGMDLTPAKKAHEDGSEEWIQSYLDKIRR